MIEWKKYDPSNPPVIDNFYLVSNGRHVDIAYYMTAWESENRFYPPDRSPMDHEDITYFAEINVPGEDTHMEPVNKRFFNSLQLENLEKEFKTLPTDGEGRTVEVDYDPRYVRSIVLKLIADNKRMDRHLHGIVGIHEGLKDKPEKASRMVERMVDRAWRAIKEGEIDGTSK